MTALVTPMHEYFDPGSINAQGRANSPAGRALPVLPAYLAQAGSYDRRTELYQSWRRRAVRGLPLSPGDTVLDVACGTGLCLSMLTKKVGPTGAVVGVDQSPEMLAEAGRKVAAGGWRNVTLVESAIETADIPITADAALFCAAHDVLQSTDALDRVFAHLRPGAWVGATGGKWAPAWLAGLNAMVYGLHRPYVRSFDGFDRPWAFLEKYVDNLRVTDLTTGYVAFGRVA
jgi:demethylmenaquinone methyltransferase/2-methoxy-6-polyprenyl-1,4-benzoquinol methylase